MISALTFDLVGFCFENCFFKFRDTLLTFCKIFRGLGLLNIELLARLVVSFVREVSDENLLNEIPLPGRSSPIR